MSEEPLLDDDALLHEGSAVAGHLDALWPEVPPVAGHLDADALPEVPPVAGHLDGDSLPEGPPVAGHVDGDALWPEGPPVAGHLDLLSDVSDGDVGPRRESDLPRRTAPVEHSSAIDLLEMVRRTSWGVDRKNITRKLMRLRASSALVDATAAKERAAIASIWARGCLSRGERLTTKPGIVKRRRKKDARSQGTFCTGAS